MGQSLSLRENLTKKKALKQVKEYFGGLPRRRASAKSKTKESPGETARRLSSSKSPGQSHLVLGFRAFDLFDERRFALEVLADLLGGGMSSRLWKRVREELGAAYYIDADADLSLDHGAFAISAGVDHGKIDVVIGKIIDECRRVCDEDVPEDELQRTKDHMIGGLILRARNLGFARELLWRPGDPDKEVFAPAGDY